MIGYALLPNAFGMQIIEMASNANGKYLKLADGTVFYSMTPGAEIPPINLTQFMPDHDYQDTDLTDPHGEAEMLRAEVERLREFERHVISEGMLGASRYWESRWRDADAENERLKYVLDGVAAAIDTGRNDPLVIWRDQIEIARTDLKGSSHG